MANITEAFNNTYLSPLAHKKIRNHGVNNKEKAAYTIANIYKIPVSDLIPRFTDEDCITLNDCSWHFIDVRSNLCYNYEYVTDIIYVYDYSKSTNPIHITHCKSN